MKIYRSGKTRSSWALVDYKEPSEWVECWSPGEPIVLNGTIDKSGERFTEIGLELNEDDVIALFNRLVEIYRERSVRMEELEEETRYQQAKLAGKPYAIRKPAPEPRPAPPAPPSQDDD